MQSVSRVFFDVAYFKKLDTQQIVEWKIGTYIETLRTNQFYGFKSKLLATDLEKSLRTYQFPLDLLKLAA